MVAAYTYLKIFVNKVFEMALPRAHMRAVI